MNRFIKNILCIGLLLLSGMATAQYVESDKDATDKKNQSKDNGLGNWRDRISPGGNFSVNFGNLTYIEVSPLLGFRVTDKLTSGVGGTYIYLRDKRFATVNETSIYGGRLFSRYLLSDNLFAHAEYEALNVQYLKSLPNGNDELSRRWISAPMVGGGIIYPFGKRGGFMITALYNLNYKAGISPYANPWVIRAGFVL